MTIMKKFILSSILLMSAPTAMCQIDTIYSSNQVIPCNVMEVGSDAVKFTYPNETASNTLYINAVHKIIFRSGRVQEFAAATSFRKLRNPADWENVTISSIESEIKGLYKLGEVSSKAKGTTGFSNQEQVKMRAMRKLKMDAAMMGANIVYIYNMRSDGNKTDWVGFGGSSTAETSISGISYTNSPITATEVQKLMADRSGYTYQAPKVYILRKGDADMTSQNLKLTFEFQNVVNESGVTFLQGQLGKIKANRFQVVFVDSHNIYVRFTDKSAVYVYQINL